MAKSMKTCFGNNCFSSTLEADVKFFSFPKDPVRAQLWTEKVGRPCTIEHARRLFTSDRQQSITYPSEKLAETVGSSVTLLESMMENVAHLDSVEKRVTDKIKKDVDFGWISSTGCLLHYEEIVNGIVRGVARIFIPSWCKQKNRSMSAATRQILKNQ